MHINRSLSNPSLIHMALTSQGSLRQGSGTAKEKYIWDSIASKIRTLNCHILEQLNPSPTVNGARHEQVKLSLSKPSLLQSAFGSQGTNKHGSGTRIKYVHTRSIKKRLDFVIIF